MSFLHPHRVANVTRRALEAVALPSPPSVSVPTLAPPSAASPADVNRCAAGDEVLARFPAGPIFDRFGRVLPARQSVELRAVVLTTGPSAARVRLKDGGGAGAVVAVALARVRRP